MSLFHVKSNTIPDFTGSVTVFNSQGSTATAAASDMVLPSDWNSAHSMVFPLGGNTAGNSTFGGTNVGFHGGNNITLAGNGTAMSVVGPDLTPYLTTAMASNRGSDFVAATAAFAGTNASGTIASNGISISVAAGGGGLTNINVSAGTTSNNLSALTFADSNGLAFGLNGSTLTGSYTQSTHSHATAAYSGSNGSFTANTVTFGNLNNLSFYTSNGSMVASMSESTHSHATAAYSGSNGSFTANTLSFGALNGLTFYTSNGSIVGSYTDAGGAGAGFSAGMSDLGNTAGTSGTVASQIVFAGVGEIGLSQSVDGNSATLSIYEIPSYASFTENLSLGNSNNFQRPTQSTFQLAPIKVARDVSFDWIANMRSMSVGSTSFATTANTSFSYGQSETHRIVLFTKNTGANSMSLGSISSTTAGLSYSIKHTAGANGSQYTMQHGMTYPVSGGTSTYSTSYGVSNASIQISSTHMTIFAGAFLGLTDFAGTLGQGEYWVGYNQSTTVGTTVTNASGAGLSISYAGMAGVNASVRSQMGISSNAASHGLWHFNGLASVGGGTAISSISLGQVTQLASNVIAHVRLGRFQ